MDNKAKKVFNDKLKGFEAPVDDKLWASIDAGINNGATPLITERWKWAAILLLLLTFTGIGYLLFDGDTQSESVDGLKLEQIESVPDASEIPVDKPSPAIQADDFAKDKEAVPAIDEISENDENLTSNLSLVSGNDMVKNKSEAINAIPIKTESGTIADATSLNLELKKLYGLAFSPLGFDLGTPVFPEQVLLDSIPTKREDNAKRVSFKWHAAMTFNYLNITPNTQDDVFFIPLSSGVSFSLDRIGFRPGIEMQIPINDKLAIKNDLLISFRRYNITFDYINDASQTENTFERFSNAYSQVAMGLSTALNYQVITLGQRRIDLDFGVSLEQMLSNQLKDEVLLGSPKRLFSLNIGLSLYPKHEERTKWIIRPFSYFSLNQKASAAPANLTPYGFGIQFSRNR